MTKRLESRQGEVLLEAQALSKNYRAPSGELRVLRGIDFEVRKGDLVMIVGRSGSGKSTFLHLLGGLDKPTSGSVFYRRKDLSRLGDRQISEFRSRHVGFVFQLYYLLPELTLFENMILPATIAGTLDRREAEKLLDRVGLAHRKSHYPSQLSGGEQQRVAIARALVNNPDIVLCDEPTGNLDEETADSILDLLVSLNEEEQKAFVIVTHEMDLMKRGKLVYELREGRLQKQA